MHSDTYNKDSRARQQDCTTLRFENEANASGELTKNVVSRENESIGFIGIHHSECNMSRIESIIQTIFFRKFPGVLWNRNTRDGLKKLAK